MVIAFRESSQSFSSQRLLITFFSQSETTPTPLHLHALFYHHLLFLGSLFLSFADISCNILPSCTSITFSCLLRLDILLIFGVS